MTFSKRNFAAACLLLGTSALLVSCNKTLPGEVPELTADTADCIAVDAGNSEIHKSASTSQKPHNEVKTADIDTADCIKDGL